MSEVREGTLVRISEPEYTGLSTSSSLSSDISEDDEPVATIESYFAIDQYIDEPLKKKVKTSILKDSDSHNLALRGSIIREYKRFSSIKGLKRQSKVARQSLRARLSVKESQKQPQWQQNLIDLNNDCNTLENDHDLIKFLGVKQVGIQLISGCSMLANEHRCADEPFANMEMPHNFLSWDLDDCFARLDMSMVWFNLLQKQLSPKCLETRKISADFSELKRIVNFILQGYLERNIEMSDVLQYLYNAEEYIDLEDTLEKELRRNSNTYTTQLYRKVAFTFIRRVSEAQRGTSEDSSADDGISHPVVFRYLMNYQDSIEDQHELQCDFKEKELEDDVQKIHIRLDSEEYCSESTMNYYYNENASLRRRLQKFTAKYDKDYENIMSQIVYTKLTSTKLEAQQEFLTEQIKRFHDVIKEFHAAKIAEQEAEIAQQQAAAEAEAKRLLNQKRARRRQLEKAKNNIISQNTQKLEKPTKKSQNETTPRNSLNQNKKKSQN